MQAENVSWRSGSPAITAMPNFCSCGEYFSEFFPVAGDERDLVPLLAQFFQDIQQAKVGAALIGMRNNLMNDQQALRSRRQLLGDCDRRRNRFLRYAALRLGAKPKVKFFGIALENRAGFAAEEKMLSPRRAIGFSARPPAAVRFRDWVATNCGAFPGERWKAPRPAPAVPLRVVCIRALWRSVDPPLASNLP